jgi:hypothetical protein
MNTTHGTAYRLYGKRKNTNRFFAVCKNCSGDTLLGGNLVYALIWSSRPDAETARKTMEAQNPGYVFQVRPVPRAG